MDTKMVAIDVLPELGKSYIVFVPIPIISYVDMEEQINNWINDNLINVQCWAIKNCSFV